jgi:hypothetical protein
MAQCELGKSAIIRAMQAYERGGWKAVSIPIVGRPFGSGRQLTAEQEQKIQHLIQDRTPDQLKLSYSPELNPDELLNADLKQHVTKAAPARNKIALTRTAVGTLRSIQKQPRRIENYFGHKDVAYAA